MEPNIRFASFDKKKMMSTNNRCNLFRPINLLDIPDLLTKIS